MRLRGNQSTTRHLNRRLVLDLLRREGALSRVALAGATGLSPAAITGVVGELMEEGLVVAAQPGESSGGRKPIPVRINYEGQNCLGIKLSDTGVEVSITDMAANPLDSCRIPLHRPSPQQATDAIGEAADKLMERRSGDAHLAGVGIAMPGTIDVNEGVCRYANHLRWENVPIARLVSDRLGVPVWVDNDVNAYAIAQHLFGAARHCQSALFLIVGTGVGAAMIINNRLNRGANFLGGEIGFVRDGEGVGAMTWEERFSAGALKRRWEEQGSDIPLAEATANDMPAARALLETAGAEIGQRLAILVDMIDPEMVVVGGEALGYGAGLCASIAEATKKASNVGKIDMFFDTENNMWERGAAALATQTLFDFESAAGKVS